LPQQSVQPVADTSQVSKTICYEAHNASSWKDICACSSLFFKANLQSKNEAASTSERTPSLAAASNLSAQSVLFEERSNFFWT
jgi:hypothetical protein